MSWLYLVPAGAPVQQTDEFRVSAMHVWPELKVRWEGSRTVLVEYRSAAISVFKPRWSDARVPSTKDHPVAVELRQVDDAITRE